MEKFKEIKKMGDGSFGTVTKAQNIQTSELVAIKKMKQKYSSWDECMNLRELKALQKLKHINIIKLKEGIDSATRIQLLNQVIRLKDELSFVFEFVDQSIYQLYTHFKDNGQSMPEDQIRSLIYQTANALAYMHKHGFFHRDLKPENILVSKDGVLKLIDFGLAREIRSRPPYTDYVATRWYRAPEILLKQTNYNSPVDIFALGCIMSELYLNRPIFSGSSEMDQLNKILSILGTFTQQEWPEGHRTISQMGINLTSYPTIPLNNIINNACPDAINLINQMLKWDPNKRITATQMLQHPYFSNIQKIVPSIIFGSESTQTQHQESSQQYQIPSQKLQQSSDENYQPTFGSKNQMRGRQIQENNTLNELLSKQTHNEFTNPRQFDHSRSIDNTYQPSFSSKPLRKQESKGDIDEMLDLLDQTTKDHYSKPSAQRIRPAQHPSTIDAQNYLPASFNSNTTKSALKFNRNSIGDNSVNYGYDDRNHSIGADYGSYLPSQIANLKQPRTLNHNISNQGIGLSLPPQQISRKKEEVQYSNSIYNFDNVSYKPDLSLRMKQQQIGGLQMPGKY